MRAEVEGVGVDGDESVVARHDPVFATDVAEVQRFVEVARTRLARLHELQRERRTRMPWMTLQTKQVRHVDVEQVRSGCEFCGVQATARSDDGNRKLREVSSEQKLSLVDQTPQTRHECRLLEVGQRDVRRVSASGPELSEKLKVAH